MLEMEQSLEPSDDAAVSWPDRPTCHDSDWGARGFGTPAWRPAGERLHPENDHVPAFRTCSYCGSIHPEDLINALRAGAKASGSDWKYGWPHKFYVEGIPNSQAGNMVTRMSGSGPLPMSAGDRAQYERYTGPGCELQITEANGRWRAVVREPDTATTHGKWYNAHLMELSQAAFDELAPVLHQHTGIAFVRDADGRVRFSAPSPGYQR